MFRMRLSLCACCKLFQAQTYMVQVQFINQVLPHWQYSTVSCFAMPHLVSSEGRLYGWSRLACCCIAEISFRNFFFFSVARSIHCCLSSFITSTLSSITDGTSSFNIWRKQDVPYLANIDFVWLAADWRASSAAFIFHCSWRAKRFLKFLALFGSTIHLDVGQQSHEFTKWTLHLFSFPYYTLFSTTSSVGRGSVYRFLGLFHVWSLSVQPFSSSLNKCTLLSNYVVAAGSYITQLGKNGVRFQHMRWIL